MAHDLATLPLAAIDVDPDNRDVDASRIAGLAASIAAEGLREPLEVFETFPGAYMISAGHHRHAAVVELGWHEVPCFVVDPPATDAERHARRCSSNWARVETTPSADYRDLSRLRDLGMNDEQLAALAGRSAAWVRHRLALGTIDPACLWVADRHGISWAAALADLPPAAQRACARALESEKPSRARFDAMLERARARARELAAADAQGTFAFVQETWTVDAAKYLAETPEVLAQAPTSAPRVREVPLGLGEVAAHFGVAPDTVQKWRRRMTRRTPFPEPDLTISGVPMWWEETVAKWGGATGRRAVRD